MKFQQICLATLISISMSACVTLPKATLQTNIPFFYGGTIKVYNSAGKNIVLIPQSRGDGFVAEYKNGNRVWYKLWIGREKIPVSVVALQNGQSFTLPIYRNTSNSTVPIPLAVKVLSMEKGKIKTVIGFYNYCCEVPPLRDTNFDINFSKRELEELKDGYTGHGCNSSYGWGW